MRADLTPTGVTVTHLAQDIQEAAIVLGLHCTTWVSDYTDSGQFVTISMTFHNTADQIAPLYKLAEVFSALWDYKILRMNAYTDVQFVERDMRYVTEVTIEARYRC